MARSFLDRLFKVEEKEFRRIEQKAHEIDALKDKMAALSDEDLKAKTAEFKELLKNGKTLEDIQVEAYAVAREAAKRSIGQFPFLTQVMGALVLHEGNVAEMKTGEGKTLASTMAGYLNALSGKGVHVLTVNDYLAKRDAEWMGSIYRFLGLRVGVNGRELSPKEKQEAFKCDITYTTNAELGFDYLRDNMLQNMESRVLPRHLYMALVDECDSILIDESRTPLIISGGQRQSANLYITADNFAKSLTKDKDYTLDVETKTISLTKDGNTMAEKTFKIDNLYRLEYSDLVHHIHQALKANYIMQKDVDYIVKDDKIVIVDQFTG
ncbi:MAG: preprotein translocase subunit SecA, partial [Bacilli bacterium]|nr:preprotein translocase subunit SecA [Bacilli bacterium]